MGLGEVMQTLPNWCKALVLLFVLLPSFVLAQGVTSTRPVGTNLVPLLPNTEALTDDKANPTLSAIAAYLVCYDGTTWDRCRGTIIDTDDNSIAASQATSLVINENYFYNGSAWVRMLGNATDGLLVNLGANNDVTVTGSVTVSDGAGALNVIVDSSALPSGAATAALQDGIIKDGAGDTTQANVSSGRLHVDGSGVTQPVSGTVTVTDGAGALNVICDSGCGGGTQYAEDTASGAADQVTMAGAVRKDTAASLVDTDGDRTELQTDSSGRLRVTAADTTQPISGTVTVTDGSGALNVICDSGCGGAATFEDNDAFVADTTAVNVMGALYDTTPPAVTDGNAGAVRMNSNRQLMVDGSGVTQPVSGTVTVTDGSGALNVIVDSSALPSGAATSALQDGIIKDGAGDTTQANVSSGRLHVDGSGVTQPVSGTVTANAGSGTFFDGILRDGAGDTTQANVSSGRLQVDGSGVTQPVSGTVTVGTFPDNEPFSLAQIAGTAIAAHDGNTLENPLLSSGYAETPEDSDANTLGNRVSADGDKVRQLMTRYGEVFTREGGVFKWTYHENSSNALTDTTVHASCGTGITFSTNAATAASLLIEDGTTTAILGPYYLEAVAGRGMHLTFPGGKKQTNSATLVSVTTTGAIAHGLDIQGFCAP
jgi:hypothetical protein